MGQCSAVPSADSTFIGGKLIANPHPGIVLKIPVHENQPFIHVLDLIDHGLDLVFELQEKAKLIIHFLFLLPDAIQRFYEWCIVWTIRIVMLFESGTANRGSQRP